MELGMDPKKGKFRLDKKWIKIGICVLVAGIITGVLIGLFSDSQQSEQVVITFDTGGAGEIDSIKAKKGSRVSLPTVEKDGYVFAGWHDGVKLINGEGTFNYDTSLVAEWVSESGDLFIVIFDSDGGSIVSSRVEKCGERLSMPEKPTREGYEFAGWKNSAGEEVSDGAKLKCESTTLIAAWKKEDGDEEEIDMNPGAVPVTDISLDKTELSLIINSSEKLNVKIVPEDATNKAIIWTSSDPNIVSVKKGTITAKGIGDAVITAKSVTGAVATANVHSNVEMVKLTVNREYIAKYTELGAKNSATFTVTTVPDAKLDPAVYVWEAPEANGATSVASFSPNGKTATITALDNAGGMMPILVSVKVGKQVSSTIKVIVEPKLVLSGPDQATSRNVVTIHSSVDIDDSGWLVNRKTRGLVENRTPKGQDLNFTPNCTNVGSGSFQFTVEATTRAGQKATHTVTCTP